MQTVINSIIESIDLIVEASHSLSLYGGIGFNGNRKLHNSNETECKNKVIQHLVTARVQLELTVGQHSINICTQKAVVPISMAS